MNNTEMKSTNNPTKRFGFSGRLRARFALMLISIALLGLLLTCAAAIYLNSLGLLSVDANQILIAAKLNFKDNSKIFDRNGNVIAELFDEYQIYTEYEKIPQPLINAIVAIEDKRFFKHPGVDWRAILRAGALRMIGRKTRQGASTITQQVVRRLILTNERSLKRKITEISYAIALERRLSKQKILELYCNVMFLGNGAYGVSAAARKYFSKNIDELSTEQYALIAGLFQSPSRYNPLKHKDLAKARQKQVLDAMKDAGFINAADVGRLKAQRLKYKFFQPSQSTFAEYFVDYVNDQARELLRKSKLEGKGLRIYTTLDPMIQSFSEKALRNSESTFTSLESAWIKSSRQDNIESAILVTDHRSGEILAMVGGRNYKSSQFNRAVSSKRSPGSAFKPIVYATALQNGSRWNDVSFVSPINIDNYKPKNYNGEYLTESTLFRAFYRSINSTSVELANKVGLTKVIDMAKNLGFESNLKNEMGTALGSSDATLLDMGRVYGTFANDGYRTDLIAITHIESKDGKRLYTAQPVERRKKKALSEPIAHLLTGGMRAVLKYGTGYSSRDLAGFSAGKTGTSNSSTDNWFCGFTREFTAIVWVGTDKFSPLVGNQTGGTLALPIWDFLIRSIYKSRIPTPFATSQGIAQRRIDPIRGTITPSGVEAPFLISHLPDESSSLSQISSSADINGTRDVFKK